jgi:hypothetical protein
MSDAGAVAVVDIRLDPAVFVPRLDCREPADFNGLAKRDEGAVSKRHAY